MRDHIFCIQFQLDLKTYPVAPIANIGFSVKLGHNATVLNVLHGKLRVKESTIE